MCIPVLRVLQSSRPKKTTQSRTRRGWICDVNVDAGITRRRHTIDLRNSVTPPLDGEENANPLQ
jgi:hypothetical protein